MQKREDKAKIIEELAGRFRKSRVSFFASYKGITVAKLTQFRRDLKQAEAEFTVAKKTLMRRALGDAGIPVDAANLAGEVGIIFGYGDQVAPAKAAAKFAKASEGGFALLQGALEGKVIDAQAILALAKLPGRDELLAQVAAAFQAPIRGLAVVLQANIRNLAVVLSKVRDQRS